MFIGTRRRKNFRKLQNISGDLQPFDMDPGSSPGWRALKDPGFARPYSVIPTHAPALIAAMGRSYRGAEDCPRGSGL